MHKTASSDIQVDLNKWMGKLLSHWWLFLIGLVIAIPAGQIYIRYATPLYSTKAKLLIKSVGRSGNLSELNILAEGLGIEETGKDMDNEIQVLMSRPIMTKTVERLGANITCFRQGMIKHTELYKKSPVVIDSYSFKGNRTSLTFYIKTNYYQDFEFRLNPDEEGKTCQYGESFENEFGKFLISQNPEGALHPGIYQINVMSAEDVAEFYKRVLIVEVVGAKASSSILELKLINQTPEKAKDFINTLIDVYNEEEIADKTQVLKNTLEFTTERINRITEELNSIESDIERFKSENDIITDNAAGSLDFSLVEMRSSVAKLSSYEVEKELLSTLLENLANQPPALIPTSMSEANASLENLINEYNRTFLQQKKLKETASMESPLIITYENKLVDLKKLLISTVEGLLENLQIPLNKTREEIRQLKTDLISVPSIEKQLLEKLRMQGIKESLFLFLLQKKEETELSMAISTANTRIIESAKSSKSPVFPQKKMVLLGSILLGLIIPFSIVILLGLFETTIDSEEALKNITDAPIIARIARNKSGEEMIINPNERTIRAEMFRLLRTNLNYINVDQKQQTILTTSSITGEGKSVISLNLGLTIALSGKKVVVVDMDLRKPKVSKYIGASNNNGVTSYIMGQCSLDQIINAYPKNDSFFYITCGHIPPNPSEMIMSDKMKSFIQDLQQRFDYVILDSPPIGAVSDGLLLRDFITTTLYVVRHKYTKKDALKYMAELHQNGELVNPYIVINDIRNDSRMSAYGGYSASYGSGYYVNG